MDARTRRLLEAPIGRTLLRLAVPNVLVMLVQTSTGLIETYFVARLGTDALAGMALVFPVVMLTQMMSAGAMGGGIMSAVARTLGANRRAEADALVWYATLIAVLLGVLTTAVVMAFGRDLYGLLGGRDGSLAAAETYSSIVFAAAVFIWLFNSLAAVIRGTGNMNYPAIVMTAGAAILIPLSPALIEGWGPLPALGIRGGAYAFVGYYVVGTLLFAAYLWGGRGVLAPSRRPPRLAAAPIAAILKVGVASSIVSLSTNVAIATATGLVGVYGPAAVAGYGTGVRLEYLLVPMVFGLGAPIGAMVGTAIGAGDRRRALATAWTGALIAGLITESIGVAAALAPTAWLGLFGQEPDMLATGSHYLRIVGPFYGAFGSGLSLYFAAQGAGRVGWPLFAGLLRLAVALGGGLMAVRFGWGLDGVFAALGIAMLVFPIVNGASVLSGSWFTPERRPAAPTAAAAAAAAAR